MPNGSSSVKKSRGTPRPQGPLAVPPVKFMGRIQEFFKGGRIRSSGGRNPMQWSPGTKQTVKLQYSF